jgi:hypothetical protein
MLAIHISHDTLRYAQLVNFKGSPFIESLGKIQLKEGLLSKDSSSGEVIRTLADHVSAIRNSADFPDNGTHLVVDSDWFPSLVHHVDGVLQGADLTKYLKWRMGEMLESSSSQYRTTHQELRRDHELGIQYLSICLPVTFDEWVERIVAPSELKAQKVILDIQALGDMLAASGHMDEEGGIQVILENQDARIRCHIFQDQEFIALFHASVNWDYKLTVDHARGSTELINPVVEAIEKAIKGKHNPDNEITSLFYFTSSGDPALLNNLSKYKPTCQPLDLVHHFNFRDPDFENIDEYAVVLGALSTEIQERFSED